MIRQIISDKLINLMVRAIQKADCLQINNGEAVLNSRMEDPVFLERYGYKVYSQNDEDGIIEEIFNRIGEKYRTFVEFGVQNGLECNSHFLLHKGWKGIWIEGGKRYCKEIRDLFNGLIENKRLLVKNAFINKDNIDRLILDGLNELGIGGGY
ncbi:MAG: hypothetical protein NC121_11170 [Blautia sp.]|nr:hypothetical protein [Blautia sp.]